MIEQIADEIMNASPHGMRGDKGGDSTDSRAEIRNLARRDYGKALRDRLSRWEVREILKEGRQAVWPSLNKAPVKLVSPKEFGQHWSALGLNFKFTSLPDTEGLSLLGFYVKDASIVGQRPLIWVNTAHHPAIVGAALDHEMGHHVVSQMFALDGSVPQFLKLTAFEDHLADPGELAADILVSLCIYPSAIAQALLNNGPARLSSKTPPQIDFAQVLTYIGSAYGLRFDTKLDADKTFHALAALIHFTKLRRAILEEYNI